MNLALTSTERVNSVRYYVNETLVGGSAEFPFQLNTLVPPTLRNGQPLRLWQK